MISILEISKKNKIVTIRFLAIMIMNMTIIMSMHQPEKLQTTNEK